MTLALVSLAVFLLLMVLGMWAPIAIAISALGYIVAVTGWVGLKAIGFVSWGGMNSFTLTAIPLFILMSELLVRTGIATRAYGGLSRIVARLPGGLLQTNIVGCAVFSAISGSSVATAATIGTVAVPELLKRGYSPSVSAGSLAAGGTLGIMIPPSIAMIIYGTFTETSVTKLFLAGVIPGLMLTVMFMLYIGVRSKIGSPITPPKVDIEPVPASQTLTELLPIGVVIGVTLGSLYAGLVTPTEAAALGCAISLIVSAIWGNLNWTTLRRAVREAMLSSAAMMFIVFSAFLFSYSVGIDGVGQRVAQGLAEMQLSVTAFLLMIVLIYVVLGCLLDSIGMMVVTIPVLAPALQSYGIDLIWFGVVLVLLIELGQLTPPMGINLFVIQSIWPRRFSEVVRGAVPFMFVILIALVLLWYFPDIATWLPRYAGPSR